MTKFFRLLTSSLALTQLVFLSACGDGGTTDGSGGMGDAAALTYGEIESIMEPIRLDSARMAFIEGYTQEMQAVGTASYRGYASFDRLSQRDILALAKIEVNFSTGSASGELTNFTETSRGPLIGSVAISNGALTGNQLTADLSGSLLSSSDDFGEIGIVGVATPLFIGSGGNYIRGDISSDWTFRSGTDAEFSQTISGEIGVKR